MHIKTGRCLKKKLDKKYFIIKKKKTFTVPPKIVVVNLPGLNIAITLRIISLY
jgi:hypothetical protein